MLIQQFFRNISPSMRNNNDTLSYVLKGEAVCCLNFAKYLEINIDNQLSFITHINNLEINIARSVGVIAKLRYYLSHNFLSTLYYSLVHFHYALPIWTATNKTYLTKFQRLQNKPLRTISRTRIRDSISSLCKEFKVLKIDDLLMFEMLRLCTNLQKKTINFESHFSHTTNASSRLTCQTSSNDIFYRIKKICDINAH